MEELKREVGEWIDKEPRADGKPRRWKPFETRSYCTTLRKTIMKQAI
jgi:hypothetical protein